MPLQHLWLCSDPHNATAPGVTPQSMNVFVAYSISAITQASTLISNTSHRVNTMPLWQLQPQTRTPSSQQLAFASPMDESSTPDWWLERGRNWWQEDTVQQIKWYQSTLCIDLLPVTIMKYLCQLTYKEKMFTLTHGFGGFSPWWRFQATRRSKH